MIGTVEQSCELLVGQLQLGGVVVLLDSPADDSEGELVAAAAHVTPDLVSFLIRHGTGFLRVPIPASDADRLDLPRMRFSEPGRPDYGVTVDAADGISTGISAFDRALTIRHLASATSTPDTFKRPGHVLPHRVTSRSGDARAWAASELARLASSAPVAVTSHLISRTDPNELARGLELRAFAETYDLPVGTVGDVSGERWVRAGGFREWLCRAGQQPT